MDSSGSVWRFPANPPPHTAALHIVFDILVSVLAGVVSRGHAAALLSTGTGILLVVLLQSLTVPLNSPLPWMGGSGVHDTGVDVAVPSIMVARSVIHR